MKRVLILATILVTLAVPAMAKTSLFNLGYNVHHMANGWEEQKFKSLSVNFVNLNGDAFGFYSQFTPYYGLSWDWYESNYTFSDNDITFVGSSFMLGYGGDLNFGIFGIVFGGGVYGDINYHTGFSELLIGTGLGAGANVYIQPGSGDLVINIGASVGWRPYNYYFDFDSGYSGDSTDLGRIDTNINIGIGFRTGGSRAPSSPAPSRSDDW